MPSQRASGILSRQGMGASNAYETSSVEVNRRHILNRLLLRASRLASRPHTHVGSPCEGAARPAAGGKQGGRKGANISAPAHGLSWFAGSEPEQLGI